MKKELTKKKRGKKHVIHNRRKADHTNYNYDQRRALLLALLALLVSSLFFSPAGTPESWPFYQSVIGFSSSLRLLMTPTVLQVLYLYYYRSTHSLGLFMPFLLRTQISAAMGNDIIIDGSLEPDVVSETDWEQEEKDSRCVENSVRRKKK
jgi:hypothetical protein